MPTRRIFELAIVTAILARPAFGMLHLWGAKTLGEQERGTILHTFAEIIVVIV